MDISGSPAGGRKARNIETYKSDTVDLPFIARTIHANIDGSVRVLFIDDTSPVDLTVIAGVEYHHFIKRIYSTGTTASVGTFMAAE